MLDFKVLIFIAFAISVYAQSSEVSENEGIMSGRTIRITQAPYTVSLRENNELRCGGSIVHQRFVLTAAHCINENRTLTVVAGTNNLKEGGEVYEIEKYIPHVNFSSKTMNNDVGLVKLKKDLIFHLKVLPITIPGKSFHFSAGMTLNVIGWGQTDPHDELSSTKLRQVSVPYVKREICQNQLDINITRTMFCAGENKRNSCTGDDGGPVTWGYMLVGITSYHKGACGTAPHVYTNTKALGKWINHTITKNI